MQRRSTSKKAREKEHATPSSLGQSQGEFIASVVKTRTTDRARAHIISILREAIHKMETEGREYRQRDRESVSKGGLDTKAHTDKEMGESATTPNTRKSTIRASTARSSQKKHKKHSAKDMNISVGATQTPTLMSASTTLTSSALKTPRLRAKSTEGRLTSSKRARQLESSVASIQAENAQLEEQLRKLKDQLKAEQKERMDLQNRLAVIERSTQILREYKAPADGQDLQVSTADEAPQNSPNSGVIRSLAMSSNIC